MFLATFKVLLIGDSGVGKSCLLMQFCDATFLNESESSATIGNKSMFFYIVIMPVVLNIFLLSLGVDFKVKLVDIDGKKYKLTIWVLIKPLFDQGTID